MEGGATGWDFPGIIHNSAPIGTMLSRTIAFLLGILVLQQLAELPSPPGYAGSLSLLLLFIGLSRRYPRVAPLALCCFGFLWAALHAHSLLQQGLDPALEGEELLLSGEIVSLPEREVQSMRFLFEPDQATQAGREVAVPRRLRLNWYRGYPETLAPGQRWQLQVKLKRPWGMLNPGGFDYESWLFQQGIRATGYVRSSEQNRLLADRLWQAPLQRLRFGLLNRLEAALAGHPAGGIVIALALGERGAISDRQWEVLLASGTNHLVAISGLHVGLVAGLLFFLVLALWRRCPGCCLRLAAPKAAAVAALLAGFAYAALAGFSIPTQRAMLMLLVVLGARLWQRPLAPLRALALALWLVLLWQPLAVLAAGFWLSFAAVALILFGMSGRLGEGGLWWKWGRVQVLASLGLLPLLLLFFQQGSLSAPLANLIAVPLVGFAVVPLTLLGTALVALWPEGGGAVLRAAADLFQWLWPGLEMLVRQVPLLSHSAPLWTLVPGILGVAWLLLPRGWPLRGLGGVLLLPMLLVKTAPPAEGSAEFTLLDVGQSLAAVVQTRRHTLVFDTGQRFPSGFDTGKAVLLPFLRERGIDTVDILLLSHADNDHMGGARSLSGGIPIRRILTSAPHRVSWARSELCRSGQSWQWDGVAFAILHPPDTDPGRNGRGNDDSCVLMVSAAGQRVLLPGDIEADAERLLLAGDTDLHADVLVAPHHGSRSSSTRGFIEAVQPAWVLYPVGYRNRFGFPKPDVAARYRQAGGREIYSYRSGALSLTLGAGEIRPRSWRRQVQRYWHSRWEEE